MKAKKESDSKIKKFKKLKRIGEYVTANKSIEHFCLIHKEIHKVKPSDALSGAGAKCCNKANMLKHTLERKEKSKKEYDLNIKKFGRVLAGKPGCP